MNENTTELMQGLYGSFVSKSRVVGICKYHKTAMTTKTIKQHGCLCKHGRQCDAFQKCENHPIWQERARMKEIKKERRYNQYGEN